MIPKIKICTLKPFTPTFPPTPPRIQKTRLTVTLIEPPISCLGEYRLTLP